MDWPNKIKTVIKSIELVIPVVKVFIKECSSLQKKIRDNVEELNEKNEDLQKKQ